MSALNSKINGHNHSNSFDSIFIDEDVQRFDADSYKEKYGDRWKKLATTIRDVVQSDGTIIREYVIDDPSMLEHLSDGEGKNEMSSNSKSYQFEKINNSVGEINLNYKQLDSNLDSLENELNESIIKKIEYNSQLMDNEKNERNKYFKPILPSNSYNSFNHMDDENNLSTKFNEKYTTTPVSKDKIEFMSEEEIDQEVEKIHEQGNFSKLFKNWKKILNVEYI